MALAGPSTQLRQSWEHLSRQWQDAVAVWNDPVRWQFDAEFWKPLQSQVPSALMRMDRLAQVMAQAQHEVR